MDKKIFPTYNERSNSRDKRMAQVFKTCVQLNKGKKAIGIGEIFDPPKKREIS